MEHFEIIDDISYGHDKKTNMRGDNVITRFTTPLMANVKLKNRIFLHRLLDTKLDQWERANPENKPFVSLKIFQFKPEMMRREYYDHKKMNFTEVKGETTKIKKNRKKQIKTNNYELKKFKEIHHINDTLKESVLGPKMNPTLLNRYHILEIEEYNIVEIDDVHEDEVEFEVQTFDHPPDSSIDVLKLKQNQIIDHDLLVKMPSIACFFNFNDPKVDLDSSILNKMASSEHFNVEYIDYFRGENFKNVKINNLSRQVIEFIKNDEINKNKINDLTRKMSNLNDEIATLKMNTTLLRKINSGNQEIKQQQVEQKQQSGPLSIQLLKSLNIGSEDMKMEKDLFLCNEPESKKGIGHNAWNIELLKQNLLYIYHERNMWKEMYDSLNIMFNNRII